MSGGHPSMEELLDALATGAPPAHADGCAVCGPRLALLRALPSAVAGLRPGEPCPSDERLSLALAGSADDALLVHVASCASCREVLAEAATLLETPPEAVADPVDAARRLDDQPERAPGEVLERGERPGEAPVPGTGQQVEERAPRRGAPRRSRARWFLAPRGAPELAAAPPRADRLERVGELLVPLPESVSFVALRAELTARGDDLSLLVEPEGAALPPGPLGLTLVALADGVEVGRRRLRLVFGRVGGQVLAQARWEGFRGLAGTTRAQALHFELVDVAWDGPLPERD